MQHRSARCGLDRDGMGLVWISPDDNGNEVQFISWDAPCEQKYTAVLYVRLCSGADCGSSLVGHWETDSLPKRHQLWRGFREGRILTCKALKGNIFFIYTCMMRHQQIISNLMFESRECKKRLNLWTNGEQNLPFCNRAAPKTSVT